MILLMGVDPAVALLIEPVHFPFEPQLTWLLCLARLARLAGYTELRVAEHTPFGG